MNIFRMRNVAIKDRFGSKKSKGKIYSPLKINNMNIRTTHNDPFFQQNALLEIIQF
ncbi:hypothetical protein FUAX_18950 [Fulvitalea axinellae]|uniref:Uncharacterized protein n=1 Tax=Fulvitalea axinellae TaxID=1182444 RepID=A0AAU9CHE2_9BACT|nr:hypothetical protein FUAX_18950 [Fulvitalea axinellae]